MFKKGTHSYQTDSRNNNIQVYINGKLHPRSEAHISVFNSGFLLGDGVARHKITEALSVSIDSIVFAYNDRNNCRKLVWEGFFSIDDFGTG